MPETTPGPLSGRRAQAARNDQRILLAAKAVFLADPGAPIAAVAEHAGVGISALYRRYTSKEELLRKLCSDGLALFVAEAEAALNDDRDEWTTFADFMHRLVDAEASSMTLALAGRFVPTSEMYAQAEYADALLHTVFERSTSVLRPDAEVHDLSLILELVASLKVPHNKPHRTQRLRHRYLTLILDGLRSCDRDQLPGPPPSSQELNERWTT
jgi:AcrR family transcriptional regulator